MIPRLSACAVCIACCAVAPLWAAHAAADALPEMYYTDSTHGEPFAKDPDVVRFGGRYLMYYTARGAGTGLEIGIAESSDLVAWTRVAALSPAADYEANGLAAPAALVYEGQVHLFYQTYGNGPKDALCHAVSEDGLHFTRNASNPIFAPTGDWTVGRAIDAEVARFGDQFFLYFATRDPEMKTQMVGVATAPVGAGFGREAWTQHSASPILAPKLAWEQRCIEASALCARGGKLYMFYAGAYNNSPQQIGCAVSTDGIRWTRLSDLPLLPNGPPGAWNSSESGHPGYFRDDDGQEYLFFQGNNDGGKSWHLSKMRIAWEGDLPYLVRPGDGKEFRFDTSGPLVIAHRGASGYLPEHTLAAYAMAYGLGADFIEIDLVLTKDGQFIALHDLHLERTTDVANLHPKRSRADKHWYAADFTLEEVRGLKVHERTKQRFPPGSSSFQVPTVQEVIELVAGLNLSTGRQVGLYLELKQPAWHAAQGLPMEAAFLAVMEDYGYRGSDAHIFVQCFEAETLIAMRKELGSQLPMVQLISDNSKQRAMTTEAGLKAIATYAQGIGPAKGIVYRMPAIVQQAHHLGLLVHPYTVRDDDVPKLYPDANAELEALFIEYGVDGVFTDFPDTTAQFLKSRGMRTP